MGWFDARVANAGGALSSAFGEVGDAFAAQFEQGLEIGAGFAAVKDGELVVDIRGGFTDRKKENPWTEDTIACIYSSGKAVLSLLTTKAVSDGKLDFEKPVSAYWPEFTAAGKAQITVAELLSHQAGLCGFADEMPPALWLDWRAIIEKLEAMAPLWPPGTANGYHPQTAGFLAGEVLRRADGGIEGRSVGDLLEAIAHPQSLQVFCGLNASQRTRAATMQKPPKAPDLGDINRYTELAFLKPWSSPGRAPVDDWMAAEIPGSNMHADARSLALLVHPFVSDGNLPDGDPLLAPSAIDAALRERIRGDDLVLPFHLSWSAGLMRNINQHFGPNENAFGHSGFGGSCVLIDPENNLTAAYVMNKMSPSLAGDPRAVRLLNAVYDCL